MLTQKDLKKAGVPEDYLKDGADSDEQQLTGIAAIREKKRLKEVDDLFALMNEED